MPDKIEDLERQRAEAVHQQNQTERKLKEVQRRLDSARSELAGFDQDRRGAFCDAALKGKPFNSRPWILKALELQAEIGDLPAVIELLGGHMRSGAALVSSLAQRIGGSTASASAT